MESKERWKIVASGTIIEGAKREAVFSALKSKFHFSDANIDRLLNGQQKVVKKGLDQVTAYKYKQALLSAGVDVKMQRMPRESDPGTSSGLSLEPTTRDDEVDQGDVTDSEKDKPSQPTIGPGEMQCPKCKSIQFKATECASCGVIVSRFRLPASEEKPAVVQAIGDGGNSLDLRTVGGFAAIVAVILLAIMLFSTPDSLPIGSTPEALAQSEALRESYLLSWPKISRLRQLVQSGDYYSAERIIRQLHDQTMVDIIWEDAYIWTVYDVSAKNGFSIKSLNNWVDASHSAIAYLARGAYYSAAAQAARGDKWAIDTSAAQFAKQLRLAKKSRADLEKALSLDDKLIPADILLGSFATIREMDIDKEHFLKHAIDTLPGTLQARYYYMRTINPKWGGSLQSMEIFADEAIAYLEHNPRLWLLKGRIPEQLANSAMLNQNWGEAISRYTDALEYGFDHDWLNHRAFCLAQEGQYEQAMADINRTLEIYPKNKYALELKLWLEQEM